MILMLLALVAAPATAQNDGAPAPSSGPTGTSQQAPGAERYDAIGYATVYQAEARPGALTAAHDALPSGSFAEVTALDSGKTIIVLIADRGVGAGSILSLSPGAMAALGAGGATTLGVRVRRVNPVGADQQALRDGRSAAPRIDAPPVLLNALRKRLQPPPAGMAARPRPKPRPGADYAPPLGPSAPPVPTAPRAPGGGFYVQIAALSNPARAAALADELGGLVMPGGGVYRVRLGPFADAATATRARDDIAQRGYADARLVKP